MITLEQAKEHLRIDHDDEDQYIRDLILAATFAVQDYLNYWPDGEPGPVLRAAVMLQVGDLYENRERQTDKPYYANATYERLLNPYRVMDV